MLCTNSEYLFSFFGGKAEAGITIIITKNIYFALNKDEDIVESQISDLRQCISIIIHIAKQVQLCIKCLPLLLSFLELQITHAI